MGVEILVLEKNERVRRIFEKIFLQKNLNANFVQTEASCLATFQNAVDCNGKSSFSFVILGQSDLLPGGESLEKKIQGIDLEQEIFFLPLHPNPDASITKESSELIEKPFSLISLLTEIEIKNQTNGQQVLA